MNPRSPIEELHWVSNNSSLEELMERYPKIWEDVGQELVSVAKCGQIQKLTQSAHKARSTAETWANRIQKSRNNPNVIKSALPRVAKSRMYVLTLEKCSLATAAGKVSGKVRFNLINGYIIQKLLFKRHLTRKPVSLKLFRFWWLLVTQKKLLIPLLKDHGIYCFYSKELLRKLAELIGERTCLEIAAGDGTLARFLNDIGVPITATDDYSWNHAIEFPQDVEKIDAKQALAKYQSKVVICSWPPVANNFERYVFKTKSVDLYIVIGSYHQFISGNWEAYTNQKEFDWSVDEHLSNYVIPPESRNAVFIFRRRKRELS